jgi:hypothetical protein
MVMVMVIGVFRVLGMVLINRVGKGVSNDDCNGNGHSNGDCNHCLCHPCHHDHDRHIVAPSPCYTGKVGPE